MEEAMSFENIMPSERKQSQKNTYFVTAFAWNPLIRKSVEKEGRVEVV